jgi:pilus assembly protein FimV
MGRRWILLIFALLTLGPYPRSALSLGLGDIVLHSALDEPLDADIPIVSARPQELQSLDVGVAPAATFQRTGVERALFLSRLRFEVLERRGMPYVHVTSTQPVREPFLDAVIEATWPKGRLERRYILLLDPRGPHRKPTVRLPIARAEQRAAPPVRPRVAGRQAAAEPVEAAPPVTLPETYGPVSPNETLWRIAERFRPDPSVSMQQMMLALLKANPDAFIDGNINLLKAGARLRIPEAPVLRATAQSEAAREVRQQTASWRAATAPAPAPKPAAPAPAAPAPSAVETKPAARPAGQPAKNPEEARLELVEPTAVGSAAQGKGVQGSAPGSLQERLTLATEEAQSSRQEATQLRGRVEQLEGVVANMQRLLTLKNEELAKLQASVSPGGPKRAESGGKAAEEGATSRPAGPSGEPTAQRPPTVARQPAEEAHPWGVAALTTTWEKWRQNSIFLYSLIAAVLVLGTLSLVAVRGRRAAMATRTPRRGAQARIAAPEQARPASRVAAAEAPAAVREDFLGSADRMVAARRYADAEGLLQGALDREPARQDLRLKLLEVYSAAGNRDRFMPLARQVLPALGAGAAFERVRSMGRELAPEEDLFREPTGSEAAVSPPVEPGPSEVLPHLGSPEDLNLEEIWSLEGKPAAAHGGGPGAPAETETPEAGLADLEWDLKESAPAPTGETLPELNFDLEPAQETKPEDHEITAEGAVQPVPAVPGPEGLPTERPKEEEPSARETFEWDLTERAEAGAEPTTAEPDRDALGAGDETVVSDIEEDESALAEASANAMTNRLDLAKAYIDLGDTEDARALLEEIRRDGDEAARTEAEEILSRLA